MVLLTVNYYLQLLKTKAIPQLNQGHDLDKVIWQQVKLNPIWEQCSLIS
jgi:hypothetical protein